MTVFLYGLLCVLLQAVNMGPAQNSKGRLLFP